MAGLGCGAGLWLGCGAGLWLGYVTGCGAGGPGWAVAREPLCLADQEGG